MAGKTKDRVTTTVQSYEEARRNHLIEESDLVGTLSGSKEGFSLLVAEISAMERLKKQAEESSADYLCGVRFRITSSTTQLSPNSGLTSVFGVIVYGDAYRKRSDG